MGITPSNIAELRAA